MKRFFFTLVIFLISNSAFSKMQVLGTICGMKLNSATNLRAYMDPHLYHFPLNNYKVDGFFVCNLKYTDNTPITERKLDLNIYRTIIADGKLDLQSYDQKNGLFIYNLSLQSVNINNDVVDGIYKYKAIKGRVYFNNGRFHLPVEGKVKFVNGKPVILNTKISYFNMRFISSSSYNMILTRIKDFPVLVEFDIDNSKLKNLN